MISSSYRQVLAQRHLYCWILDTMTQMTCLEFKRICFLLKLSFVCHLIFFLPIFHQYLFSWSKWIVCNRPAHINIAFIGKPASTYVVSTDVEGVGTTYDVTWGDACDYSSTVQIAEEKADIADCFKNQYPTNSLIGNSCFLR